MDFGLLPPEVNSGRMYSGEGPGPLLAAAGAWSGLAAELNAAVAGYQAVVADLSAGWHGPSAEFMTSAVMPYLAWLSAAAAGAEHAGAQAASAVAAYEAAFAATVPPPMIAANRSLLATLVATNILGQNTPAIAATEAHYAEMWAQDAGAMYGYAGAAAATTRLTPFTQPPRAANDTGRPAEASTEQTQLGQLMTQLIAALQQMAGGTPAEPAASPLSGLLSAVSPITGPYSPLGYLGYGSAGWLMSGQLLNLSTNGPAVANLLSGKPLASHVFGPLAAANVAGHTVGPALGQPLPRAALVSAASGQAGSVGRLSVPANWAAAAPATMAAETAKAISTAAANAAAPAVGGAAGSSGLFTQMALSSLAGRALVGSATQAAGASSSGVRVLDRAPDTGGLAAGNATIFVIPAPEER